jgi:hypothetical protein
MGRVIGKEGKIIQALRTLMRVAAMKKGKRVRIELLEPQETPSQEVYPQKTLPKETPPQETPNQEAPSKQPAEPAKKAPPK